MDNMPVLLRDMAGDAPLLSLDGALLMGREWGRVVAGETPRAGPLCAMGLVGLVLLNGLHLLEVVWRCILMDEQVMYMTYICHSLTCRCLALL